MNDIEILKNLSKIFKDVMEDENLIIDKSFTANDIDGWDSLTHIMLIFEIEKNFEIKFYLNFLLLLLALYYLCLVFHLD